MSNIITELSHGILRIELNRPERKNALTSDMYTRLAEILADADGDDEVRVVLWHGAGDSFSAGNDVKDFLDNPPQTGTSPQARLTDALIAFGKPIVAAVHGAAVGGGTTMLTHCDLVFAAESARFQTPFVNLGLTPEFGSSFSIPMRAGHARAAEIFLLGEPFTAARAAELGLVTRVVPDAEVLDVAAAAARKLAAKPSETLRVIKRLIKRTSAEQLRQAVAAESTEFAERVRSPDAREAFAAFLEKRPPNFNQSQPDAEAA